VPPGKHYIAVEYDSRGEERTPGTASDLQWPRAGGLVLYPDAAEIAQAQQVEVRDGETVRLNDIHLTIARFVAITDGSRRHPATKIML
jgi:hypothetical protein